MNLCTNAAHAMDEKGGALEVSLRNVDFERGGAAILGELRLVLTCDSG